MTVLASSLHQLAPEHCNRRGLTASFVHPGDAFATLEKSLRMLKPGGTAISAFGQDRCLGGSRRTPADRGSVFPFEQLNEALAYLETGYASASSSSNSDDSIRAIAGCWSAGGGKGVPHPSARS